MPDIRNVCRNKGNGGYGRYSPGEAKECSELSVFKLVANL
jgi:hypothetical protein